MKDLRDMSLIDLLGLITTFGEQRDRTVVAEAEPFTKDFLDEIKVITHYITKGEFKPTDEQLAQTTYMLVMSKYDACSEKEKRDIVRSDIEFKVMMQHHIAKLHGFVGEDGHYKKDLKDIFGEHYVNEPVPRIPRGNEMLWSDLGDPEPPLSNKQKRANKAFGEVIILVWDSVEKLYPQEFKTAWPIYCERVKEGRFTVVLNKSRKEEYAIIMRAKKDDQYYKTAIRGASYVVVEFLGHELKMNPEIKKVVYSEVTKHLWNELTGSEEVK